VFCLNKNNSRIWTFYLESFRM